MNKLTQVVRLGDLRSGYNSLVANVKNDIQYDHISLYANDKNVEISKIIDTYDFKRIVNTAINDNTSVAQVFEEYNTYVNILEVMLNSINSTTKLTAQFMTGVKVRFGGTYYDTSNPKEVENLNEKLRISRYIRNTLGVLIQPRSGYTIPKNSDYASEEIRQFICKPVINEIIISTMIHSNATKIDEWRIANTPKNVSVFGPRVTMNGEFIPYIYEYNLMSSTIEKLRERCDSVIITDISKYFQSIKNTHITTLFTDIFKSFKESQFLASQLVFDYIDSNGSITTSPDGLTIESNYQHYLANIFMEHVLSKFLASNPKLEESVRKINFVSYIDDIFIFINHKDNLNVDERRALTASIYDDFKIYLHGMFQLSLNENKTKFINGYGGRSRNALGIKEFIRLPTFNYIELLNNSVDVDNSNIFECSDSKISSDEWLQTLKEIVEVFESTRNSPVVYMFNCLSPLAKRVVFPYVSNIHTNSNIIHSKFIGRYIITRLNEMQLNNNTHLSSMLTDAQRKNKRQKQYDDGDIVDGTSLTVYDPHSRVHTNLISERQLNKYSGYHDYLTDSLTHLNSFMQADNIAYYISKYDDFEFDSKLVNYLGDLDNWKVDGTTFPYANKVYNILEALQYLYLCRSTTQVDVEHIVDSCMNLITLFPNKSRFIAGIIKKHLKRVRKLNITTTISTNSEDYITSVLESCSLNPTIAATKFDYFKYCLNKLQIKQV